MSLLKHNIEAYLLTNFRESLHLCIRGQFTTGLIFLFQLEFVSFSFNCLICYDGYAC